MNILEQISIRIIKQQELIIGSLAWDEAEKVSGLKIINQQTEEVLIEGESKEVVDKLVAQYTRLFGKVSQEVCKDAVQDLLAELTKEEIPLSLQ